MPDVPPGFEWPRWLPSKPRDDKFAEPWRPSEPAPLAFIAQIDLSAVPHIDDSLPATGWLYFFYDLNCEPWGFDPADRGSCRALYFDTDRTALTHPEHPSDADPDHLAEPCRLKARLELTLPDQPPEIEFDTPAHDAYLELCDELAAPDSETRYRLLGHPQLIQNPMELECQLASNGVYCGGPEGYATAEAKSLEADARDWRLLLQIDSDNDDDGPGWMWGDCGRIYFWVKQQDLQSLRFDDALLILQCS